MSGFNALNQVQAVELDILDKFIKVAEREGLSWFAMLGTLLGAVRHGGFIPWDDDIDIVMPRPDYNRLLKSAGWFNEPYFLQTTANDPGAAPRFIRLRRSDTAIIADYPNFYTRGGNMGIYIDIMPLDIVPDLTSARRIQLAANKIHRQMFASAAFDESGDSDVPESKEDFCYREGGVKRFYGMFCEAYEKICSSFSQGHYYSLPALSGDRGRRLYDREWFKNSVEMDFNGLKISAPEGWKESLIVSYPEGLYEPDVKFRRRPPDENTIIDTKKSYLAYTYRYTDMLLGIEDKKVYIFGAGDSLRIWLERYGKGVNVVCAFDNSRAKWRSKAYGIPVKNPAELTGLIDGDSRLIISSVYHKEIGVQLDKMGIKNYYVFIDGWNYRGQQL